MIRATLLILLLCTLLGLISTPVRAAETTPDTPKADKQKLSLIEFYTLTNTLPRELIDLQHKMYDTKDLTVLMDQLPTITRRIDEVDFDARMTMSNASISYHQLSAMESRLVKIKNQIDKVNAPIEANIRNMESWYRLWLDKENELREFI